MLLGRHKKWRHFGETSGVLWKNTKNIHEKWMYYMYNCRTAVKFGTSVAHDKPIPHAKQNFQISTYVIDNDVIMSKFECFRRKALNLKRLYDSSLWIKLCKIWSGY